MDALQQLPVRTFKRRLNFLRLLRTSPILQQQYTCTYRSRCKTISAFQTNEKRQQTNLESLLHRASLFCCCHGQRVEQESPVDNPLLFLRECVGEVCFEEKRVSSPFKGVFQRRNRFPQQSSSELRAENLKLTGPLHTPGPSKHPSLDYHTGKKHFLGVRVALGLN